MIRMPSWAALLGLLLGLGAAGCNTPPEPLTDAEGRTIKTLAVNPEDPEELQAVKEAEAARVLYAYNLEVLQAYYREQADVTKLNWARQEARNLQRAQWFTWEGVQVVPPAGESIADADEHELVERTVASRRAWIQAVQRLEDLYARRNESRKLRAMETLQGRYDPVRVYMYFLDAEIPGPGLRPVEVIPEADTLYNEALALYRKGKGWSGTALSTNYDLQRRALVKLLGLVRNYPNSTKIGKAAYFIGEIYKEYFDENYRAVHWYQRAWQWDAAIDQPARFQAAVVYDLRLQDPRKAIELYRESIKYDPWRLGNYEYANERIAVLTEELKPPQEQP